MTRHVLTSEGRKVYTVCPACGKKIRVNKPVLGAIHWCQPKKGDR